MNTKPKKTEKPKDQFIMLPFKYVKLKTKEIGRSEIDLLALIGNLSQQRPCTARNEVMAGYLGVSERTIQRYIKKLIDAGYLISQPNPKAISGRTLIINDKMIDSICGEDDCKRSSTVKADRGDNPVVVRDGEGDNYVVVGCQPCHGGTTDVTSGDDNSCFENAVKDCNPNNTAPLIDNRIDNPIEKETNNNIPTDVGTSANADVNAPHSKESAFADLTAPQSGGASHLTPTDKIFESGRDRIIEVMLELQNRGMFEITDLIPGTDEYENVLVAAAQDFLDMEKAKTVDDVICQLKDALSSYGRKK